MFRKLLARLFASANKESDLDNWMRSDHTAPMPQALRAWCLKETERLGGPLPQAWAHRPDAELGQTTLAAIEDFRLDVRAW